MKIIDLLSVITDETKVQVWEDCELVAEYDGKEAIDESFNKRRIKSVSAGLYKIDVEI